MHRALLHSLILLFVTTAPTLVHADPWDCIITGQLQGETISYWLGGIDSWSGPGSVRCVSGKVTVSFDTFVRFEGHAQGIGVGPLSQLLFQSAPISTDRPESLAQDLPVKMAEQSNIWTSSGKFLNPKFLVFGVNLNRFANSLREGCLRISTDPKSERDFSPGKGC